MGTVIELPVFHQNCEHRAQANTQSNRVQAKRRLAQLLVERACTILEDLEDQDLQLSWLLRDSIALLNDSRIEEDFQLPPGLAQI